MNPVILVTLVLTLLTPAHSALVQSLDSDTVGLRKALTALLNLDDGELKSLMTGQQVSRVAENLSPETQFLLKASGSHLSQLQELLSSEASHLLDEDLKIARRRKNLLTQQGYDSSTEPDSLLGALADLSANLQTNNVPRSRARRSHGHRRPSHSHGEYWLQSGRKL